MYDLSLIVCPSIGGSLHVNQHISAEETDQYKKLKALFHYHRRNGVERLLYIQSKERRKAVTEGINYKPVTFTKCISLHNDKKCGQRAMPFSKYCTKRILVIHDSNNLYYGLTTSIINLLFP